MVLEGVFEGLQQAVHERRWQDSSYDDFRRWSTVPEAAYDAEIRYSDQRKWSGFETEMVSTPSGRSAYQDINQAIQSLTDFEISVINQLEDLECEMGRDGERFHIEGSLPEPVQEEIGLDANIEIDVTRDRDYTEKWG